MKKRTGIITLVLITAALASCDKPKPVDPKQKKVYMRGDTTAPYGQSYYHGNGLGMWYYAFRPYGSYYGGSYHHSGYYSGAISERSNVGYSSRKSSVVRGTSGGSTISRGGFGSSGRSFSVSS